MSQESNKFNTTTSSASNETQFFMGTPSLTEVQQYFLRQKRIADLREPELESSPELSDSFECYLQQRKQKIEEEKRELASILNDPHAAAHSPLTSKSRAKEPTQTFTMNNTTINHDDTLNLISDDSFLKMEKECEKTMNLNNESSHLIDLTTVGSPSAARKSLRVSSDETRLDNVEAPSFLFNNTSLMSPNKNSPFKEVHANRPSTILEVSEETNRTNMSYLTAFSRSRTEASSEYKTAEDESYEQELLIKMPKIRSFYDTSNLTKDSLEITKKIEETIDMTKDSLNDTSGVETDKNFSSDELKLNDTLEQIEYMLEQAQKQAAAKETLLIPISPMTPRPAVPKIMKPKALTPAAKHSPLIKFSPIAATSHSAFKKPLQSASKIPQHSSSAKKFIHVQSPIATYIKNTPSNPLKKTGKFLPGIDRNSPRQQFNFRDSDSFANENKSFNAGAYGGSSLPQRAKTKSSAIPQIFESRDSRRTPGGKEIKGLLANSAPTVTVHQGHVKNNNNARDHHFRGGMMNETALSEQSFADLSLMSGDLSVQLVEGVNRL